MLKISKRLMAVAGLVPEGGCLADVGTDHGYVPIWLLENGRISSAIAMDINRGPLLRAEENRDKYGFTDCMELRLSDGLSKLRPGEAETLLIAGIGGPLMVRILEDGARVLEDISTLVLSPHSDIPLVRRYLLSHGFRIEDEIMLTDEGKYYTAMKVVHGCGVSWTETEYLFGRCLLQRRHPVLLEYLKKEKRLYIKIRENLEEKGRRRTKRYGEVSAYLKELERALVYYN